MWWMRATKKKPNQTTFRKGSSSPRAARAKRKSRKGKGTQYTAIEKELKVFDKVTLFRYYSQYLCASVDLLKAKLKDPNTIMIERMVCRMFLRAETSGDVYAFNAIMDRCVGPVTQKVEIDRTNPLAHLTDEELRMEREKLRVENEKYLRTLEKMPEMFPQLVAAQEVIDIEPTTDRPADRDEATPA